MRLPNVKLVTAEGPAQVGSPDEIVVNKFARWAFAEYVAAVENVGSVGDGEGFAHVVVGQQNG